MSAAATGAERVARKRQRDRLAREASQVTASEHLELPRAPSERRRSAKEPLSQPTRLAATWRPSAALRADLAVLWPRVDQDLETRRFVDYWKGVPGRRGMKYDWEAIYRNWITAAATQFNAGSKQ
jgi:hypothetical protein